MKIILVFIVSIVLLNTSCKEGNSISATQKSGCITGVLVIKGICGQRVISVRDTTGSGLALNASWEESGRGDTLTNVFTVSNSCDFPSTVNEGDTIQFRISTAAQTECITCKAYVPIPAEQNNIEICESH